MTDKEIDRYTQLLLIAKRRFDKHRRSLSVPPSLKLQQEQSDIYYWFRPGERIEFWELYKRLPQGKDDR